MSQKVKIKFDDIFDNKLSSDEVLKYLIELHEKGETSDEIASAASSMRDHMIKLQFDAETTDKLMDNCGTGGDKSNSFNISTTVSMVLASCGVLVAKHGNRSITSNSGSADMLEALGVNLNISLENQLQMLKETGFVFMFAANHHPAMKHIMPIRKQIPHRTIFNILGPLSNPANVSKQFIGVFDKSYVPILADALIKLNTKRAMVVSSSDGMDEISISDLTYAALVSNKSYQEFVIDPRSYGLKLYPKDDICGGDANFNADITKGILSGDIIGAKLEIVLINSACALFVYGLVESIEDGIVMAQNAISSGKALQKLDQIIAVSNKF